MCVCACVRVLSCVCRANKISPEDPHRCRTELQLTDTGKEVCLSACALVSVCWANNSRLKDLHHHCAKFLQAYVLRSIHSCVQGQQQQARGPAQPQNGFLPNGQGPMGQGPMNQFPVFDMNSFQQFPSVSTCCRLTAHEQFLPRSFLSRCFLTANPLCKSTFSSIVTGITCLALAILLLLYSSRSPRYAHVVLTMCA